MKVSTLQRCHRILDGGSRWGALNVSPTRHGVTRYRLVLFPPGMTDEDRMLLRAWRAWPIWGMAAFVVAEIVLVPFVGTHVALGISTALTLGPAAVLAAMTGPNRGRVRTLSAVRMAGLDDSPLAERFAELSASARELAGADRALADGHLDAVAYELLIWRLYDRMAADERTRT